jgi:hypothetical protein
MRARLLAPTLLLLAAGTAGAQGTPAVPALADPNASEGVRLILASAPARGIPVEPLVTKVREGVAKSSTPERIHDAVRNLAARLETAAQALAPARSADEVAAGAGAIGAGVPPATLRAFRARWQDRPVTVPLGVLTELVTNGVPPKAAGDKLLELMKRGATTQHITQLGVTVGADVAMGWKPQESLDFRARNVFSLLAAPFTPAITMPIRPGGPPGRR